MGDNAIVVDGIEILGTWPTQASAAFFAQTLSAALGDYMKSARVDDVHLVRMQGSLIKCTQTSDEAGVASVRFETVCAPENSKDTVRHGIGAFVEEEALRDCVPHVVELAKRIAETCRERALHVSNVSLTCEPRGRGCCMVTFLAKAPCGEQEVPQKDAGAVVDGVAVQ
jgi:hypothetical protein